MNHGSIVRPLIVAAAMAAMCSGCVIPASLEKEGKVCEARESAHGAHYHDSTLGQWHIAIASILQMDNEFPRVFRKFVNVLGYPRTALQDIEMHVVNRWADPIPDSLGGCHFNGVTDQTAFIEEGRLERFVFAFGIAEIDSTVTPPIPKSPHMIVFLPLHSKAGIPPGQADQFRILLLHMESDVSNCPDDAVLKARCEALQYLRSQWTPGADAKRSFRKSVASRINDIIGPELQIRFHNGVIHGNF
jgi:hypothetical protein